MGSSVPPLPSSTEAFPPLQQHPTTTPARNRRRQAWEEQFQPYPPPNNSLTANSIPANSFFGQQLYDTWHGSRGQPSQSITTQQHFNHFDAPCWQFPPVLVQDPSGSRHVSDPRASTASIRGNSAYPMASGHVNMGMCPPFSTTPGFPSWQTKQNDAFETATWLANGQTFAQKSTPPSQHFGQPPQSTVGNHVSVTCPPTFKCFFFLDAERASIANGKLGPNNPANPSSPHYPNISSAPKSFANVVTGGTSNHRASSSDLFPSSYPYLCYGQISEEFIHPGFVKSHVLAAG